MQTTYNTYGRRYERTKLDAYVNKIMSDEPYLARSRDISAGGMFLYKLIEPTFDLRRNVALEFALPGEAEVIWAVGRVVREEQRGAYSGIAVEFVRISEADRDRIGRFVARSRMPRPTPPQLPRLRRQPGAAVVGGS